MADEQLIINGSIAGVPISITSSTVRGGNKVAIKQFPNKDTQNVEPLGLIPRKFTLEIDVSNKLNESYFGYRNRLLAALESTDFFILVHPLFGRINNVICVSYSINENMSSFGDTVASANFEVNTNTGIPASSANVSTQIAPLNVTVQSAVNTNIVNNFEVNTGFFGNFKAAVDKVNAIIDKANEATEFIGEAALILDDYTALLGDLTDNVNSLVSNPTDLANSITTLFETTNSLYQSANATFETFIGFFDFGDDDLTIRQDTAGRVQRKQNDDLLNSAVAASALGYAYVAITRIDFETVRELDDLTSRLDDQFVKVQESTASQEVKNSVTDTRIEVLKVLDEIRINTNKILEVTTNLTTARLLSFDYYGDDSLGQDIANLNNITDVSFVEGDVEILTQ